MFGGWIELLFWGAIAAVIIFILTGQAAA